MKMAALTDNTANVSESIRKSDIQRMTKEIGILRESIAAAETRRRELNQERESLLMPARLSKDNDAQKKLHAVDAELGKLTHDIADDTHVLEVLSRNLEQAERSIAITEWENKRSKIREMLLARSKETSNAKRIKNAVTDLIAALQSAQQEDQAASAALLQFDSKLRNEAKRISRVQNSRSNEVAIMLRNFLPVDLRGVAFRLRENDLFKNQCRIYSNAVEALDRLEIVQ